MVTFTLLAIGGLNWLGTAFNYNVVEMIFHKGSTLTMIIYVLVGLSAIYELATHKSNCKCCSMKDGKMGGMDSMKSM